MRPILLRRDDRSIAAPRAAAAPLEMNRHARRFVLFSTSLLLVACSSLQLGYNNADTLLAYTIDSYLDLDEAQQVLARGRIDALHRWHRATQLNGYAQLLDDAQRRLAAPLSAADVLAFNAEINARLAVIGEQVAPDIAQLAATLQPRQIDRLADKLAREQSKERRELQSLGGREPLSLRVERAVERAENWLGTLSHTQREALRDGLARQPDAHEAWLQEREQRHRDLLALLARIRAEQPPLSAATLWVRAYFAQLAEPRDEQRRARLQRVRAGNAELVAQLLNSATLAQRAALVKKLRGYAGELTTLATAGNPG